MLVCWCAAGRKDGAADAAAAPAQGLGAAAPEVPALRGRPGAHPLPSPLLHNPSPPEACQSLPANPCELLECKIIYAYDAASALCEAVVGIQVDLLLTLEEFCGEEGVFEGTGEQGGLFSAVFAKASPAYLRCQHPRTRYGPSILRAEAEI